MIRKEDTGKFEAFEMWIWRKMERISWTKKITNDEVLRRVGESRTMMMTIGRRKKNWIEHINQREEVVERGDRRKNG